jgi:hypothetical protein
MKAIYDKYGEYGLKEGVVAPDGSKFLRLITKVFRENGWRLLR